MTSWTARLRRVFDIRPGEVVPVLLLALYLATVVAAFLLAKAIRSGLFLEEHGPLSLMYVYAAVPVAVTIFVPLHARLASGRAKHSGVQRGRAVKRNGRHGARGRGPRHP